ncbi:MAG: YceI family protein [Ignavibacteriae bacterium]|nr:YceI family protein [Ignavibacteriota bacterium]
MKSLSKISVVGILLLAATAIGFGQTSKMIFTLQPGSKVWFDGTSTLHNFTCEAKVVEGSGTVMLGTDWPALSSLTVRVPVMEIESGKESMNENMQEALNVEDFKHILYEFTSAELLEATAQTAQLKTSGILTVAGNSKSVEMNVTATKKDNGAIQFTGSVSLLMTDFGVEPPTMFLGTIKTGDAITVHFDVTARNANTTELR